MEKKNTFFFAPDEVKLKREYHSYQSLPYVIATQTVGPVSPIKANYKITAKRYKKPFINRFYSSLKITCLILFILNIFFYGQLILRLW